MANGIYNDINSAEDQAQMEENREKMYEMNTWFKNTALIETIALIYLIITSPFHLWLLVPGIVFLILMNRKNAKIFRTAALAHIVLAATVIILAVIMFAELMAADSPAVSLIPSGVASALTSVSSEELAQGEGNKRIMALIMNVLRVMSGINIAATAVLSVLPVRMNARAVTYCELNDELKQCAGYPYFHPDIALQSEAERIDYEREHRIQTDTQSAVSNAQLMKRIREQQTDFKDTDALFAAVLAESGKTRNQAPGVSYGPGSGSALDQVNAILASNRSSSGKSSYSSPYSRREQNTFSGLDPLTNAASRYGDRLAQFLGARKETENGAAMKALAAEAERLRAEKQQRSEVSACIPQPVQPPQEIKVSTWGDTGSVEGMEILEFDAPETRAANPSWADTDTELEKILVSDLDSQ